MGPPARTSATPRPLRGASPQLFGAEPEAVCPFPLVVLGYLRLATAILEIPASPYPNRREAA